MHELSNKTVLTKSRIKHDSPNKHDSSVKHNSSNTKDFATNHATRATTKPQTPKLGKRRQDREPKHGYIVQSK